MLLPFIIIILVIQLQVLDNQAKCGSQDSLNSSSSSHSASRGSGLQTPKAGMPTASSEEMLAKPQSRRLSGIRPPAAAAKSKTNIILGSLLNSIHVFLLLWYRVHVYLFMTYSKLV